MIPYGPTWRTEWRTVVQLTLDKLMTDDEAQAFITKLKRTAVVKKAKCEVKIGKVAIPVTFTPDRPESETTPQPGYVPPMPLPPGR